MPQHSSQFLNSPMDKVVRFQIGHTGGDLNSHVEEDRGSEFTGIALTQVVEEVAMGHVLGHYVVRRFPCTNA